MKLREELGKFGPKIVRQDDKVGTLWLERGVGMRIKTLEKFDVDGFVCVVNPLGEPEFVLKVVVLSDYLPLKIYKVEWAIETRGESLPDSFVEDDFADGIIVRYPSSVLSGEMNNGEIEIGCGMIAKFRQVENIVVESGRRQIKTMWIDIETSCGKENKKCSISDLMKVRDKISLGLSLIHLKPAVEMGLSVKWNNRDGDFVRGLEFGGESNFKYTDKYDSDGILNKSFSVEMMSKLLTGILDKDLEPLQLWRSFSLTYSSRGGFLEDKMKNLLVAIDSIYAMKPCDKDMENKRAAEYDEAVIFLRDSVRNSDGVMSMKRIEKIIKSRKYYLAGEPDYSAKMRWALGEAKISVDGIIDYYISVSHRIRNNLSHHGTFRGIVDELESKNELGAYYLWLINTVRVVIWHWLTDWSNSWRIKVDTD